MIKACIEASFDMEAAIPQIIETAIYKCYEDYGWDISDNTNSRFEDPFALGTNAFPTLEDLIAKTTVVVNEQGFDDRLKNDYIGSIRARLMGLLVGSKGLMLNTQHSVDFEDLLEHRVVLELEEIRSGSEKSLIMGFVLTNLMAAIKEKYISSGKFRHITLVEEAHCLLSKFMPGDSPNKRHGVEIFADMLAEIRKHDWGAAWRAAMMWRLENDNAEERSTPKCNIINDGFVTVDLYDKDGQRQPGQKLYIEKPDENIHVDLYKILEDRIDRGVANFFEALKLTFKGEKSLGAEKIYIFLAGNSSRSLLVKKCFDRYITKEVAEINKKGKPSDYFELFPPLGTEEARRIQQEKGIEPAPDNFFAPTGKTGVALGLIEGRAGGPVKVISEISASDEIKFRFYVGRQRRKKFKVVLDRETSYEEWTDFGIPSDETDFELYYSTMPEVSTNNVDIAGISKKHCCLFDTNPDGTVFIRAVSPDEIEFCAAASESDAENGIFISDPVKLDLTK